MKLNSVFSETLEQLIDTAKGHSRQWVKFAKENPLAQELKTRYPEYMKLGSQFVDEQKKEFRKLLKNSKTKSTSKKKEEPVSGSDEVSPTPSAS